MAESAEEEAKREEAKREQHAACEEMLAEALDKPKVSKMVEEMNKLGCQVPRKFFSCTPCDNKDIAGGFVVGDEGRPSKVVLCEDNIGKHRLGKQLIARTLVHELVHAYDDCRAQVDWKNCLHIACSEVRAARLSGDCSFTNELQRRNFGTGGQGAVCSRRRAEISVAAHPECEGIAKLAVERVFEPCFADKAPFKQRETS